MEIGKVGTKGLNPKTSRGSLIIESNVNNFGEELLIGGKKNTNIKGKIISSTKAYKKPFQMKRENHIIFYYKGYVANLNIPPTINTLSY